MEIPSQNKKSDSWTPILRMIHVFTFMMVGSMTCAQKPIQKAMDSLSTKHKKEAQKEMCDQILQQAELYSLWMGSVYAEGCMGAAKDMLLDSVNSSKNLSASRIEELKEKIENMFSDKISLDYSKMNDFCSTLSAQWRYGNNIEEKITVDLARHFKCNEVWKDTSREKYE